MYFRDRVGLISSLLVPIALVTVFGSIMAYAFGGQGSMPKVSLWIIDLDKSPRSERLVTALRSSSLLQCLPTDGAPDIDREGLRQKIADGDAHHGLVIPAGYGQTSNDASAPEIEMIRDPGRQMEDRILQMALLQALASTSDVAMWKQTFQRYIRSEGASEQELQQFGTVFDNVENTIRSGVTLLESQALMTPPARAASPPDEQPAEPDTPATSPPQATQAETVDMQSILSALDEILPVQNTDVQPATRPKRVTFQQAQSISGLSVMMMMFSLTSAGTLLLAERERGTLRRLLALPIHRESILLGKFLFVAMVGMLQMGILMTYGELMFRVGLFRDPLTLLMLVTTWVATAGSFGMAIATLSTTSKQGDSVATIIILVMAALGGCWFPTQLMNLPLPLEIASRSTLTYWAMEGFQGMLWNSLAWWEPKMLKALAIQWLWAVVLSCVSVYGFRRNYLRHSGT